MNDEARAYTLFMSQNFPKPEEFSLQVTRERAENISSKANQKLIGTFKGIEEERKVKVDVNTGKT